MRRQLRKMNPNRYLTDDETVELKIQGERSMFRMRIWRGESGPAIVLVSQVTGGASPIWASSQLANLAYRVYLGFRPDRMLNFEDEHVRGERRLFLVGLTPHGHGLRQYLTRAVRRPFRWSNLEDLVGETVAR
jgi:hypothetical protein